MRDLHRTLKAFSEDSNMDYCEDFDDVKSILIYCNKHIKPFSKIHFRGGNEPFISELSSRLQKMLLEKNYIDERYLKPIPSLATHSVLRRIILFLFANTDATYKYNLRDDPIIGHLVEVCPLLPKFLLVVVIWELRLEELFCETLSYTPCWFSFQYFEPASDTLKYISDPFEVLDKVEQMVTSIYLSIARSEMLDIEMVEKKIIFNKLYDYAANFLRLFYTPDAEKFKNFTKRQLHKYFGYALKHLLDILTNFFDIYEQPEKVLRLPSPDMEVYEICSRLCIKRCMNEPLSLLAKDQLLKLINVVLNTLQSNIKQVNIDIFMYWVEVDISPSMNLQMAIGELAFRVNERLISNRDFSHDVTQQLKAIAIRPKSLEETVREATLGEILHKLDEELPQNIKKLWFDEIINRSIALGNEECLSSIRQNIQLMSVENCMQIMDHIYLHIQHNERYVKRINQFVSEEESDIFEEVLIEYEELAVLIIVSLVNLNQNELLQITLYQIKKFGENASIFSGSDDDFNQRATEFFNKSSPDFFIKRFLMLCFEKPQAAWTRFFEAACCNCEFIEVFCTAVRDVRPLSDIYFSALLTTALHELKYLQQRYFPALLCQIYFTLYYPERKTEFLKQFINKSINEMLDSENFTALLSVIKALNLIAVQGETQYHKPLNFDEITAPVLLMAAHIMEKTRWDLITYTDQRDEIVNECIQFIQSTSKKFLPIATEKDRKWITKVMKDTFRPITQYYFQKFSQSPEQLPVDFDKFLIRLEIKDKSEAEMFLIINYVRCTLKEAEWLARSERLLPHISDMMLILGGVVMQTGNTNAVNNYRHCMVNYAHIVTKYILPKIQDNKKLEKLALKILKIIESTPAEIYDEMFITFEWVFLEIFKKASHPFENQSIRNIEICVNAMRDCKGKIAFIEKFKLFESGGLDL